EIKTDEFQAPVQEIKASPTLDPNITQYIKVPGRTKSYFDPDTFTIFPIADPVLAPLTDLPPGAFANRQGFLDREGSKFNNLTLAISWTESTLNLGLFPTAGSA